MLGFFAIELVLVLMVDKLAITGHEGDLMHMLDASMRMVAGERPHVDFMTPIGILGFAPVAGFLGAGFAVGKATLLAGLAILALLLPAVWWVGATRFSKGQAYYFGVICIITMTAVVYGGGANSISLSMYYNRWGWSIAFLVLATVLFPPKVQIKENWVAPLIVGTGMAALLMLKMTFFVPLLPVVMLLLLVQKQTGLLLRAMGVALAIGGALLVWLGPDFFLAYADNLLTITQGASARQNAGTDLVMLLVGPKTLAGTLVLFGGLFLYRKAGYMQQGLVLFILAPAFTYITYQNWGNDPKWIHLVILYLWVNLPKPGEKTAFSLSARQSAFALIWVGLTVALPSVFTLAVSPVRLASADLEEYEHLELRGGISDIWLPPAHVKTIAVEQSVAGWPPLHPEIDLVEIGGFTFPDCQATATLIPAYVAMARQIEALDIARGQPVLTADVLNFGWLVADIGRVKGAAPWYYGNDAGVADAAFLAVPFCPLKQSLRGALVAQFQEAGYGLNEVYRSALMVLYAVSKPAE